MSMLRDWRFDVAPSGYHVNAANAGSLIRIGLEPLPGHNLNNVTKGTHYIQSAFKKNDPRYAEDRRLKLRQFYEDLPSILLGGCQDWILWKSRIQLARLVLYFYSDAELYRSKDAIVTKGHAKLDIKRPADLGIKLTVPGSKGVDPVVYRCIMDRTQQYEHTQLIEIVNGIEVADFDLRKPSYTALMSAARQAQLCRKQ